MLVIHDIRNVLASAEVKIFGSIRTTPEQTFECSPKIAKQVLELI